MIIRTPRLLLRPWRRADLDLMAEWPRFPDPLDQVWNWPQTLLEQGSADFFFFARSCDRAREEWTITTHCGEVIGSLGIRNIDREARSGRLGLALGFPYIGQGYGGEALRGFLDAFFGPLEFKRMLLEASLYNTHALRLYERLGFRRLRTFWYEQGPQAEFRFLDEPQYEAVRCFFRSNDQMVFAQYVEMELTQDDYTP